MIWEKRSKGRRQVKRYYTSVQWKRFKKVHFFFYPTCEWIGLSHSHFGIIFHQSWGKVIQEQIWKSRNRVHFGSKCLPGIFNILFVCFFKTLIFLFLQSQVFFEICSSQLRFCPQWWPWCSVYDGLELAVWASLVAQTVKNLPAMWEIQVWSLGQEDPWRREWQATPAFLPGEFHRQRSLVGYSP